ncbi:ADM_collapsed_G0022340.mRNA.1.CDS.1 [Saccharomyces cerevisiae]|nr:ADM_collapsed_G0022340.mRNA.1.CDS.1 [Saccharomyces cerevisiae]
MHARHNNEKGIFQNIADFREKNATAPYAKTFNLSSDDLSNIYDTVLPKYRNLQKSGMGDGII